MRTKDKKKQCCACGCGKQTKPSKRYIHGHNQRGKVGNRKGLTKQNDESVRRASEKSKQWHKTASAKEMQKRATKTRRKKGAREKASKKQMEVSKRPEYQKRKSKWMKEANKRPEVKKRHSDARKRWWKRNPQERKVRSKRMKEYLKTNKGKEQLKKAHEASWNNSLKKRGISEHEKEIVEIFKQNNIPFVYTGDGKIWVSFLNGKNKNPDFILNGSRESKTCIEYNGPYFHSKEYTGISSEEEDELIIKRYKEIGWNCLVIRTDELTDVKTLIRKIRLWLKGERK